MKAAPLSEAKEASVRVILRLVVSPVSASRRRDNKAYVQVAVFKRPSFSMSSARSSAKVQTFEALKLEDRIEEGGLCADFEFSKEIDLRPSDGPFTLIPHFAGDLCAERRRYEICAYAGAVLELSYSSANKAARN